MFRSLDEPFKGMRRPRRVLVVESELLLSAGLESLLSPCDELEVRGLRFTSECDLMNAVEEYQPDVLILEDRVLGDIASQLVKGEHKGPLMRVVCLNLEDNCLRIYEKRKIMVERSADFLAVVS
ncbi:MAG: hypothetical protein L0Z70_09840 [Chloroflexi bacterium]|nr:hypothetical protein [Chloroflexota bacterium]